MANNPIQIVLNAQNYIQRSVVLPGGGSKDFYAGRDADFAEHRAALTNQVNDFQQAFQSGGADQVLYARVDLESEAWAKSHRPILKVFPSKSVPYVGNLELGSMIVELAPADIPRIAAVIQSAEDQVKEAIKDGKVVAKPSRARSEVGAIKSIRPYASNDRRKFSSEQALRWLLDPRTGAAYYIETFISWKTIEGRDSEHLKDRGSRALLAFERALGHLGLPIQVSRASDQWLNASIYILKLDDGVRSLAHEKLVAIHTALLEFLDGQAIVKSVLLPPVLQSAQVESKAGERVDVRGPADGHSYPVVGVVDTGVSDLPILNAWKSGSVDYLDAEGQDFSHGTFIAGLLCAGDELNHGHHFGESKCKYFDLGLHPTSESAYGNYYPRGFLDFLEQLDAEIPAAKEEGVRVLNMSLAVTTPVMDDRYSLFANMLDEIADKHDVMFVLPAGNLDPGIARDEWPEDANDALAMIAGYPFAGQDFIFQPADSIRSLVVGALNPESPDGKLFPARYSRRGPGPSLGAKPDVAHIGGRLGNESGLNSLSPSGNVLQSCGTSFASPLAAKTLAAIEHAIEGNISREALTALAIHHAIPVSGLKKPALKSISRHFVGAGIPSLAADTLLTDDHQITLVFNGVLVGGHELQFNFAWPSSLADEDGSCAGNVKLTLAYRPPIDRSFGGEFVRINLDAFLRQEVIDPNTGETSFKGRLKGDGEKQLEKELVKQGAKWWPVKRFSGKFNGVGNSSLWRLVIEPLARAEFVFPEEGVPFSAVLTISDVEGGAAIFNEMRLQLQNSGAVISDIRSALRQRIGR